VGSGPHARGRIGRPDAANGLGLGLRYDGAVRATAIVSVATAFVLLGSSILPFLTPAWVGFEQDRSNVTSLTGFSAADVRSLTGQLLGDLVLSGGDFGAHLDSQGPILTAAERQHLRDVRGVFQGFYLLILAAAIVLAVTWRRAREGDARLAWWRGVRRGAAGLIVVVAFLGAISIVAFDAAFEAFHRLFFAAGTYLFDPATSRLVQLFPDQFWSDTVLALGGVTIALAVLTAFVAGRQAGQVSPARARSTALQVGKVTR